MNSVSDQSSSKNVDQKVQDQVRKICQSKEFDSKPVLRKFLSYIIREELEGRGGQLKGYNIGVDIFDKGVDFDPGHDALVRIHAGRLRRMLKSYYEESGKDDELIITIPKGRYIPVFSSNHNYSSNKNLVENTNFRSATAQPHVGILPFINLAPDPKMEYFSQGISEELSVELTKYQDLSVYHLGYTTTNICGYANTKDFIKAKGISFLVEGSCGIIGDKVKLLARLTDVIEGGQIWAQSYTEDLNVDNLFIIQERIVQQIAAILGNEYGIILNDLVQDSVRGKPQGLDTYNAILKFYYYVSTLTSTSCEDAFLALIQAVKREPKSGIATACLAAIYGDSYNLDEPINENPYVTFGELAEKAATLDPSSLLVNTVLAVKHWTYNDKDQFEGIFEKCLKMGPDWSLSTGTLAFHYMCNGGWERGMEIMNQVIRNNLRYPPYFHVAILLYYYKKEQYKKALLESNYLNLPELFWCPMLRIAILGQLNRTSEFAVPIQELKRMKPNFEEEAKYLISRFVKENELVEHVMDGLRKSGVKV